MRDRIRTPFFALPGGDAATPLGPKAPPTRLVTGRALVGQVLDGRYLLRRKTAHSDGAVRYQAYDLVGAMEVELEIYPDGAADAGYRMGPTETASSAADLPDLYAMELSRELTLPGRTALRPSWIARLWAAITGSRAKAA